MKKIILIAVIVFAALFFFSPKPPVIQTPVVSSLVATVSGVSVQNAFQALTQEAAKQQLKVKTKQYDFGVFVEQIGTLANTKEKSWIYFVNGKSATVAADKQAVAPGDIVEWKYMTPIY